MSREPSYFEHNGMPLHASPNAGRMRQMQEPWLGLFTTHRAQSAEQRPSGAPGMVMPVPSNEVTDLHGEAEGSAQLPANEMSAAPSLVQRAATGTTGVPSTSVNQSSNQQQQHTSAVQLNQPNIAVSSPLGQPSVPVNAEPANRAEIKSVGGPEGESANLATGGNSLRNDFSDAVPLPPRVLVQKHLTIQTEISSMSAASGPATTSLPGGVMPFVAAMESPILPAGEVGTEQSETLTSRESFSAAAVLPAAVPVRSARTPMGAGAGNILIGNARQPAMPEIQPQVDRSQRALLERLNDRASPQQQAGVGRRVHIGNLRITVQRPAMAAAQTPPSAPSAQPQQAPAAAGQPLFNPWERHYMAFD
jgi:hypothetical protein